MQTCELLKLTPEEEQARLCRGYSRVSAEQAQLSSGYSRVDACFAIMGTITVILTITVFMSTCAIHLLAWHGLLMSFA